MKNYTTVGRRSYEETLDRIEFNLRRVSTNKYNFPNHFTFLKISSDKFEVYSTLACKSKLGLICLVNNLWCCKFVNSYTPWSFLVEWFVDFLNLYGCEMLEDVCSYNIKQRYIPFHTCSGWYGVESDDSGLFEKLTRYTTKHKEYTCTMRQIEHHLLVDHLWEDPRDGYRFSREGVFIKASDNTFDVYTSLECTSKIGEIICDENNVWTFYLLGVSTWNCNVESFVDFLNLFGYKKLEEVRS